MLHLAASTPKHSCSILPQATLASARGEGKYANEQYPLLTKLAGAASAFPYAFLVIASVSVLDGDKRNTKNDWKGCAPQPFLSRTLVFYEISCEKPSSPQ